MTIERISIQGFRGFLDRRELSMANGKKATSLCVFGDNGCGKSSVGDAVEFFFSEDGILSRLKKSQTENNAGISATRHALAAKKNIRTEVLFHFDDGKGFARPTNPAGAAGVIPDEIRALLDDAPVPLLMRSHEMRTFVADEKGATRYAILSRWVGLERLVAIQDALTRIEGKAKKWDKASAAKSAQLQSLEGVTEKEVRDWNPALIAKWLNERLAKAGVSQKVGKLEDLELVEEELRALQQATEDQLGVSRYETAGDFLVRLAGPDSTIGKTVACSEKKVESVRELDVVRKSLTASELRPVWNAAKDYLSKTDANDCPVCSRPFDRTTSRKRILEDLSKSLDAISALETAESHVQAASRDLDRQRDALKAQLVRLDEALQTCKDSGLDRVVGATHSMQGALDQNGSATTDSWNLSLGLAARELIAELDRARARCTERAQELRERLSTPYSELRLAVQQLIGIRKAWNSANREENALLEVAAQLEAVAEFIRGEVRAHVKKVLTALEDDVREIYASLRGNDDDIPVLDILVSQDKKSMRVAMSLFGVEQVPPSGYLSDSQLNSLGLALYLAAVRRFNTGLRFLVLDDIMSSYDASHRLALVDVLAKYLGDFQVIVTTHDRAFFRQIRAILANGGNWQFIQLKPWLFETGVRIDDDLLVDDDIERRLRDGEKPEVVAQLIMGNVEDWLLKICCDRGIAVPMTIRKDREPAEPTMGTLWSAGQKVFGEHHKKHPAYPMLTGHPILNWPRHAASAAELGITLGELQTFWKQFKTFRDDFSGSGSRKP